MTHEITIIHSSVNGTVMTLCAPIQNWVGPFFLCVAVDHRASATPVKVCDHLSEALAYIRETWDQHVYPEGHIELMARNGVYDSWEIACFPLNPDQQPFCPYPV